MDVDRTHPTATRPGTARPFTVDGVTADRCARCGVPRHAHADIPPADAAALPLVCPGWVEPAPRRLRALNRVLRAVAPTPRRGAGR